MSPILLAIAIVSGIGLVSGVGLAVAAAVMHVPVDGRIERLIEALPGANCGACGCAGCEGYAGAVAEGAAVNLCAPGGDATARALAEIMGVEAGTVVKRRAFVRCAGTDEACETRADYRGERSCAAARLLYGGQKECAWGCLGFGDCARACPSGAISVAQGIALVNQNLCTGCGLCAKACPKGIVALTQIGSAVNRCSSEAPGAAACAQCARACLGCGLCAKKCPERAMRVENHLACADPETCTGCGLCVSVCPVGCLVIL